MKKNITILVKKGNELDEEEVSQIKASLLQEFKVKMMPVESYSNTLFFLLKKEERILSMGGLKEVRVVFAGQKYDIKGFVEVIANVKGKGYGKKIVTFMVEYLKNHKVTCIGYCLPKVVPFYKKCGLNINSNSSQRFVYTKGEQKITNQDGQVIFYQDGDDHFMSDVLKKSDEIIHLPTEGLW